MFHKSVLLQESVDALAIQSDGIYVDATFGGGGHSLAILARLTEGRVFAFDQDEDAMANRPSDDRLTLTHCNFKYIKNFLRLYNALPVNGILADLGISSYQIDTPERGFSTRHDSTLDMRMDRRQKFSALQIIQEYPEEKLAGIFRMYGEVNQASKAAYRIVNYRKQSGIRSTGELSAILAPLAPPGKENKFLAQIFQALRMEVNQELDSLKEFLTQVPDLLCPGGRIVIISYHSLEDTLVKHFFRAGNWTGKVDQDFFGNKLTPLEVVNRKPIVPEASEIQENPRSRSARLRIAKKALS